MRSSFPLSLLVLPLLFAVPAPADIKPAPIFTDHAVLQQSFNNRPTPIFGTARPGESVTVTLGPHTVATTASPDGRWTVSFPNLPAGGPFTLTLKGDNTLTLSDVYVGEVWLASGQSNMEFTVAKTARRSWSGVTNADAEIAAADYPLIRMFTGEGIRAHTPQSTLPGQWAVCSPAAVGEFSAVGYFFARDLHKELGVPVGIINLSVGASAADAWIRREALMQHPVLSDRLAAYDAAVAKYADPAEREEFAGRLKAFAAEQAAILATRPSARPARAPRRSDPVQDQHNPAVLYNGMIHPILGTSLRGVLWYQGESVMGGAEGVKIYGDIQKLLITDWRTLFRNNALPFFNVQLAPLNTRSNNPDIRAQQATILDLPHTGMVTTLDVGDARNVHPKNKAPVGHRLALLALKHAYGKDIPASGPVLQTVTRDGAGLNLTFTEAAAGLRAANAPDNTLKWFELAGEDNLFHPAQARITSPTTLLVTSDQVPSPKHVRYAWHQYPEGANLQNTANLPTAPFAYTLP